MSDDTPTTPSAETTAPRRRRAAGRPAGPPQPVAAAEPTTVSAEAAWHAFRWNRVWTNYCLRRGLFRDSPVAARYGPEVAREIPLRPSLALDTIA